MSFQTASNVQIAIKRQGAKGTPASGAGATGYNVFPSGGIRLVKSLIDNPVIRRDGQKKRKRHGSRYGTVAYTFPMTQAGLDPLFEAGVRGTWAVSYAITEASVIGGSAAATSVTTTTSTIVVAAGSLLLQNLRAGMRIKLAGFPDAANNGKWLDVLDVTATVITLPAASLTLNATPDTSFTITVAKYLVNPTTLVERYHTLEEYRQDNTKSLSLVDAKICKMEFSASPDGLSQVTITFMGLDVTGASSAVFTSPTYGTTVEQVQSDGLLRIGGVDMGAATNALSWTWDMGGEVPKVFALTGPDVALGQGDLSGSFVAYSQDLALFDAYKAETVLDLHIVSQEPDIADPKDFTKVYVGAFTCSDDTVQYGQNGLLPETVPWASGIDETGGSHASTSMLISSSAA